MSKVEKIVLLINLLHHRQYIPLETIKKVCKISTRTVYRYLNTISSADIPVRYDDAVGGYYIDYRDSFGISDLRVSDAVLLSLALHMLLQRLDDRYLEDVEQLARKIFCRLTFPLEELWESFRTRIEQGFQSQTTSDLITSLLIQASVLHGGKLRLTLLDGETGNNAIEIANPSLRFKREWWLGDSMSDDHEAIPVSRVRKAVIL